MTEKRFTGEFDKQYSGVHYNGEQLTNFEVVDLLNDLSEENEQLKHRNNQLKGVIGEIYHKCAIYLERVEKELQK